MRIKSLNLTNFRSYFDYEIDFHDGVNLIYGINASGKTTILESITLFSYGRSFKTSNYRELINENSDFLRAEISFEAFESCKKIILYADKEKKTFKINGNVIKRNSELAGNLLCVDFSNQDSYLLQESPKSRMNIFDKIICQISFEYVKTYNLLNSLLKERNELLKRLKIENSDALEVFLETIDNEYILASIRLIRLRKSFFYEINQIIKDIHQNISNCSEIVDVVYKPCSDELSFEKDLRSSRNIDVEKGHTTVSIKKDECIFIINNKNVLKYGSQGQQKNLLISLKLCFAELIAKVKGDYPVVLLDDVFGDLDKNRQNKLLEALNNKCQVIITSSSIGDLDAELISNFNIINIERKD